MGVESVPPPSTVIGDRYVVEEKIGRGGMAVVVRARDRESGALVALKLLKTGPGMRSRRVERFRREVQALEQIHNEHVARVFDVGEREGGAPYMVMEFLDGEDLEVVLTRGALPPAVAIDYLLQMCDGLRAAHEVGVVHRDLKPGNVFLVQRPDEVVVKVFDFGVAKVVDDDSLTRTNAVLGSPLYMAPEQMASAKHVDVRADVWSLGAIFYEMLTGEVPFSADNFPELVNRVISGEMRPPTELVPGLPPGIEEVVSRCLSTHPDDRYQTVAELLAALQPIADGMARAAREFEDDLPTTMLDLDPTAEIPHGSSEASPAAPASTPAAQRPAPPLPPPPPDAPADHEWEDQTVARPPRRTDFDEPEGTEVMPAPEREAAVDAIKRHRIMRQRALSGTDDALGQSAPSRKRRGSSLGLIIVVVIAFFAGATLVAVLSVPGLAPPWLRDIVDRVSANGPKPAPAPQPSAPSASASPDDTAPSPSVEPPAEASSAEPVAIASASASASVSAAALSGAAGAASTAVAGQGGAPTEPATP